MDVKIYNRMSNNEDDQIFYKNIDLKSIDDLDGIFNIVFSYNFDSESPLSFGILCRICDHKNTPILWLGKMNFSFEDVLSSIKYIRNTINEGIKNQGKSLIIYIYEDCIDITTKGRNIKIFNTELVQEDNNKEE